MRSQRPKNLNLFTIAFPLPAIISILHRLSGVFLFLIIPFLLWALSLSLSENGFDWFQYWLSFIYIKAILWIVLIPYFYHLFAGIRHLIMDIGVGDSLPQGVFTAKLVILCSILFIILAGIWLW